MLATGDKKDDIFANEEILDDLVKTLKQQIIESESRNCRSQTELQHELKKLRLENEKLRKSKDAELSKIKEQHEQSLSSSKEQYEKELKLINTRHNDKIQRLQSIHDEGIRETIKQFENQIADLKKQLPKDTQALHATIEEKNHEINALKAEIQDLKSIYQININKLRDETISNESDSWDLRKLVEICKKRCIILEKVNKDQEITNKDLRSKLQRVKKTNEMKLSKQKIDYESKLLSLNDEMEKLKQDLIIRHNSCEDILQNLEKEKNYFEAETEILQNKLSEQKKICAKLENDKNTIMVEISQIKSDLEKYFIENKGINLKTKQETDEKFKNEREMLNKQIEILKAQIETLKQNNKITTTLKETDNNLTQFKQELISTSRNYEEEITKLKSELDNQKACFTKILELKQKLEKHNKHLEKTISDTTQKSSNDLLNYKKQIESNEHDIKALKQQLDKERNDKHFLEEKFLKCKKDLEVQARKAEILQKAKRTTDTTLEGIHRKYEELFKNTLKQKKILETTKKHYEFIITKLRKETIDPKQLSLFDETAFSSKLQIEEIKAKYEQDKQNYLEDFESTKRKLREQEKKSDEIIFILMTELEEKNSKIIRTEEIKKEFEYNNITLKHEFNKLKEFYEAEIRQVTENLATCQKNAEENIKFAKKFYENKLDELEQEYKQYKSSTGTDYTETKEFYEVKLHELMKELLTTKASYQEEIKNLQLQVETQIKNREDLEKVKDKLETQIRTFQTNEDNLYKICEEFKNSLTLTTKNYEQKIEEIEKNHEEQLSNYETELQNYKSQLEAYNEKFEQFKNIIITQKAKYETQIKQMTSDLDRGCKYIEELIEKKIDLESEQRRYENKLCKLKKDVQETIKKYNYQIISGFSNINTLSIM